MMEKGLPEGWVDTTIQEITDRIHYGYTASSTSENTGIKFLRITDIQDDRVEWESVPYCKINQTDLGKYLLKTGDLVFARTGATVGKSFLIKETPNAIFASYLIRVIINENIDQNFLYYFFKSGDYWQQISDGARGIGQPNVNAQVLSQITLPLPPLAEQKRIVTKLDTAFGHLEILKASLKRIPELLKTFRQSVLTQAVTGKLTEDWREDKETSFDKESLSKEYIKSRNKHYTVQCQKQKNEGKSVTKLTEFSTILNDSIPQSWLSMSVESASIFIVDCLHSTPKFEQEGEYCIDTTCIIPFKIVWKKARKVSAESFKEWTSRLLPTKGDILFSREGTIGTTVCFNGENQICLGQRMMMFRFADFVVPKFAEIYLASSYFKSLYKPCIVGTSAQHINIGSLRKLEFLVPTFFEQQEIVTRVEAFFARADAIESQYFSLKEKIDKLPQAFLAKAFRGELVPQDPDDEPASVLLKKIQREMGKIGKKGKRQMELDFVED